MNFHGLYESTSLANVLLTRVPVSNVCTGRCCCFHCFVPQKCFRLAEELDIVIQLPRNQSIRSFISYNKTNVCLSCAINKCYCKGFFFLLARDLRRLYCTSMERYHESLVNKPWQSSWHNFSNYGNSHGLFFLSSLSFDQHVEIQRFPKYDKSLEMIHSHLKKINGVVKTIMSTCSPTIKHLFDTTVMVANLVCI